MTPFDIHVLLFALVVFAVFWLAVLELWPLAKWAGGKLRGVLQMWSYHTRVWLARRWCDPQLAWLAEQYGSVLVTSKRFGKVIVPLYHCVGYDVEATLAQRLHAVTEERDYWRRRAAGR